MIKHPYFGDIEKNRELDCYQLSLTPEEHQLLLDLTEMAVYVSEGTSGSILSWADAHCSQGEMSVEPIVVASNSAMPIADYETLVQRAHEHYTNQDTSGNSSVVDVAIGQARYCTYAIELPNLSSHSATPTCILAIEHVNQTGLDAKQERLIDMLRRDISNQLKLRRRAAHLIENSELLTLALEHNQDWIFVKDKDFRIVYANESFLNVYPKNIRNKVIGYTTFEEYEAIEVEQFLEHDKIAFESGRSETIEDIHMPDGTSIIVNTVKQRFHDANQEPFILCVCRDITQKEMLIRDIESAYNDLDEFTNIASHDLKAPLNAIKRLLEWIQEDCYDLLPEESKENIQLVVNRTNRMHQLLSDLLTYARAGRESTPPVELQLQQKVNDLQQLLDTPKHCQIKVNDLTLKVPEMPFSTVLLNLISNAIKHNDKNAIEISVKGYETKHDYIVSVTDNGPGIEPQYFDKIFGVFQTLKSRDQQEGSGIGLSVVDKYMNTFGGSITVASNGKLGSTFTIKWPKTFLKFDHRTS
ncbi:sensor histidine kinase [Alteromonas oceanisediminis]|uniref:sensor histidine kinase n=1 Tax=Alteromonas oceanisediminis TaxID=2836180 RepID=UPI001BDA8E3B|nr:ATP-binding protein [Alteromonas oceanisediminis]MBT0587300.1 PAS domain-containing protein [Alteromonas oceanisediminis]